MLDPTPYPVTTALGDQGCGVSDRIEAYCQTHLPPYAKTNVAYLTQQLKWPVIIIDGRDESAEAYHRELLRIVLARIRGQLPPASREPPIAQNERLLVRMIRNHVLQAEQAAPNNLDDIEFESWLMNPLFNPPGEFADIYQEVAGAGKEVGDEAAGDGT